MSPPPEVPFPFIVGCERSGTTLLRLMLDAHPDLAVPPESYFIVELYRRRDRYERDGLLDLPAIARALRDHRWFGYWDLPADALDEALDRPRAIAFPDAIRRLYAAYAGAHGKPRYGDKTPAYVLHLPLLAELFLEARFVHLIRDGREVAMSLAEVSWGPGDLLQGALQWRERVTRGRAAGEALGPARYLEVRYEALVADPEATIRAVGAFVELPFDPLMLAYSSRARERIPGHAEGEHRRAMEPPRPGVRDPRTLPEEDLAAMEVAVGGLLEELGYGWLVAHPSARARRRAARAEAARTRRHLLHRVRARLRRA